MFIKNYQNTFLIFLITGTLIAASATSWFTAWVGLEINLMSLIPLILRKINNQSTEAAIKYFLVQSIASLILIASAMFEIISTKIYIPNRTNELIILALIIKLGISPFHFWFPQVILIVGWFQSFLILVWQKVGPFILLSYFKINEFFILVIITSRVVGAVGGLNQILIKNILTYSSIAHSSWILILCLISINSWFIYFRIYSIITITLIPIFRHKNILSIKHINEIKSNVINKAIILFSIISLGGLPPFLGFTAKIRAILTSINLVPLELIFILIASSLISLFYYLKLTYNIILNTSIEIFINLKKTDSRIRLIISLTILGNFIIPILVLLT